MIKKINKYRYWLVLTFLVTITYRVYSFGFDSCATRCLVYTAQIFIYTLIVSIFLKVIIDIILKFRTQEHFKYNQDIFYHTQWNWEWNFKKEVIHLKPTCPTCKNEVFHRFDTLLSKTELLCEKCNKQIANISSSHRNFVAESVKKSIIRKLKKEDSSF